MTELATPDTSTIVVFNELPKKDRPAHKHRRLLFIVAGLAFVLVCVVVAAVLTQQVSAASGPGNQPSTTSNNEATPDVTKTTPDVTKTALTSPPATTVVPATTPPALTKANEDIPPNTTEVPDLTPPPPTPTLSTPTSNAMPLRAYQDTGFAWRDPNNWSGDNGAPIDFATSAFDGSKISVSTFGKPYAASPVLRTIRGWSGEKILFIEWTTYAQSNTNIWLLPTLLTHQFGDPRWPNCGEYDIFEMFNGGKPAGTKNYFNYGLFGQSTTHIASLQCFAPEYIASPMVSSSAAQYEIHVGVSTAMAVIFGSDDRGQYLQQIQNPVLLPGPNATFDVSLSDGVAGARIYNDANHYWGVPPVGGCAAGFDPATGYPFFGELRLVLQEQYLGYFDVTNFLVLQKRT